MKWIVKPSKLYGTIAIPPSKSHTIRALLIATLSQGVSTVRNPLLKGDGGSALGVARALGANVSIEGATLTITGTGENRDGGTSDVFTGNSGTSTTLFSAAAALGTRERIFNGDASVQSRPVKTLLDALVQLGARYTRLNPPQDVPFTICGPLTGGCATVNGLSSQFVSALLLACPLLINDSVISVVEPHELPYIDITLWWLDKLGIKYTASADYTKFEIPGRQKYTPIDITVPADFSSATFAAVAAAIGQTTIDIMGLDFSDPQGDKRIFNFLENLGANVNKQSSGVQVTGPKHLNGTTLDLNATPDALPAFAVAACFSKGETRLTNVYQARIKETDRIAVMCKELSAMGATIREEKDGLVIQGGALHGAHVHGHDDHRVVMSLALAGMNATGETIIDTAESAAVTYPSFVEDFKKLGADITVVER